MILCLQNLFFLQHYRSISLSLSLSYRVLKKPSICLIDDKKTLTIWFSPSWPVEFYWNSASFYLIDVQQHILTACRNFFSHWHKRDHTSNVHQSSICIASFLPQLWKLCSHLSQSGNHINYQNMLGWKWCNTWRSSLMTPEASAFSWSFIPYQCQVETGFIMRFPSLWLTAYCQSAPL